MAKHRARETSFGGWLLETVVMIGLAVVLAMGVKTFIVQPFVIPTPSMEDTIGVGDRVLVNKFVYRFRSPERGDIVVFDNPEGADGLPLIKRVIAVGGEKVEIQSGTVSVDGETIDEPYIDPERRDHYTLAAPVVVPDGQVWVMGDNRAQSGDSRVFGPRPVASLKGAAFAVYWPPSEVKGL